MIILFYIYLIGIICGLYCAKKLKDPGCFWLAFLPIIGTYYSIKAGVRIWITGH